MSVLTNYRQLFLLPGAGKFFPPAALARLGVAMQSLAILWATQGASGSFAVAGLATGAFAAAEAFLAPQVARFIDSHGQSTVAVVQLPAFGLASAALVVATWHGAPAWVWISASAVAGVSCPQIGSLAAARWRHLTAGSPQMSTALALEAAVNEITHMVGPILVTTLSAAVHPSSGLVVAAGLVLVFTTVLIRERDSEPPTQARGPGVLLDTRLLSKDLVPFAALHLLMGGYFGGMTICLTSAALALGVGPYAGLMAAGGGIASLFAGLLYGAASPRVGAAPVMVTGAAIMTMSCVVLGWTPSLLQLVVLTVMASACVAPILIPAAVRLQQATPAPLYVQAITWTGSASALGTAAAAPLVGHLVDRDSAQSGYFALSAVLGLLLLTTLFLGRVRPRTAV